MLMIKTLIFVQLHNIYVTPEQININLPIFQQKISQKKNENINKDNVHPSK